MSESFQYVRESLMRELAMYRSKVGAATCRQEELARGQQLDFWLNGAVFWIVQLQISDEEGNPVNYNEAFNKAGECLDRLRVLLG
jgi:hypothetical protein